MWGWVGRHSDLKRSEATGPLGTKARGGCERLAVAPGIEHQSSARAVLTGNTGPHPWHLQFLFLHVHQQITAQAE